MKINADEIVKDVFGEKINESIAYTCNVCGSQGTNEREPLTVSRAIFSALNMQEREIDEEEAYRRHLLCVKLAKGGNVDIQESDRGLILKQINKRYAPTIYGAVRVILEKAEKKRK
jgi:hypothetical protein